MTSATLSHPGTIERDLALDIASLLCSRLCHDMLSPVGALANAIRDTMGQRELALRVIEGQLLDTTLPLSSGGYSLVFMAEVLASHCRGVPELTRLLARAAELEPQQAHWSYVQAVALFDTGQHDQAWRVLRAALRRHPQDRELRHAEGSFRAAGD